MLLTPDAEKIPWMTLLSTFRSFEPPEEWRLLDSNAFETALIRPTPPFVHALLQARSARDREESSPIRDLYAFLLEQRYSHKLNLLYFAFDVFSENSALPPEVVERTPFPHEDGVPAYRYAIQNI